MKKIGVFNPLSEDFTIKYAGTETYTAKPGKITFFEPHIARNMKIHLVDHLLNLHGPIDGNAELAKEKFMKQVSV